MYTPPSRAPTGFSFRRAGSSFSIRASNSKNAAPAEPLCVEDWIVAYDIPTEKLRKHLAEVVFQECNLTFEGDKIRLKGDNLMLRLPRMLSEDEKAEIYKIKEPGASLREELPTHTPLPLSMARARATRDHPAVRDFDNELYRCTLYTPPPPLSSGRPQGLREDGSSYYQAQGLLDYAYRHWPGYPRINPVTPAKLLDPHTGCILIFSILLMMDRGCLVHLFRSQQMFDRNLPINVSALEEIFHTMLESAREHGFHLDPIALTHEFDDLQWKFCPARFDLGEEQYFNNPKQIIPIVERSILSESGGTAVLWQVAILEEFVSSKLAVTVTRSRYREDDNLGWRYRFALKQFKEGYKRPYINEAEAFRSLPYSGMNRYLGCYVHKVIPSIIGIDANGVSAQESYNILLEYGECDLWTVFNEEMLPLVLQSEIDAFWNSLFNIAKTLSQIHYLPAIPDRKEEFWGNRWHADIKPSNVLEIDGEFKLADPGFAIFQKKIGNARPTAELTGGTKTYSAPEQIPRAGPSRGFYQTVDVWALGCVFSIAATWIALGHQGVRKYTQLREEANHRALNSIAQSGNQDLPRLDSGDYFHDGRDVLPEVTAWHLYLRNILRGTDRVTSQVLDVVDHHMLIKDPRNRWQSSEVYEKLFKISLGLEDPTSTVSPEIIEFISSSAQSEPTSSRPVNRAHGRKGMKSKYFRPLIEETQLESNIDLAQILNEYGQSPAMAETTVQGDSQMVSGPFYRSPTQSTTTLPVTEYDNSENLDYKQVQRNVPVMSSAEAKFQAKVQDIFQAYEGIEESVGKRSMDDYLVKQYNNREIKFLVDNSWSMHKHWANVKFVLKTLAMKAKGLDPDGVDLYFTLSGVNVGKKTGVKTLMDAMVDLKVAPPAENDGKTTDMAARLDDLLRDYLDRQQFPEDSSKVTIIVLTNAMWDEVPVAKRLLEFAKTLKVVRKSELTDRLISIEFIQFGRDPYAMEILTGLGDELRYKGIPDFVDVEHSDGNIYKMLLGSFVHDIDDHNPESNEDNASILRPTSPDIQDYFERRPATNFTYAEIGPPASPSSIQAPLPYRSGPSPTRELNQHEARVLHPQQEMSYHEYDGSPTHENIDGINMFDDDSIASGWMTDESSSTDDASDDFPLNMRLQDPTVYFQELDNPESQVLKNSMFQFYTNGTTYEPFQYRFGLDTGNSGSTSLQVLKDDDIKIFYEEVLKAANEAVSGTASPFAIVHDSYNSPDKLERAIENMFHVIECRNIILCIVQSVEAMENASYCGDFISILVLDKARHNVARLLPIQCHKIRRLATAFESCLSQLIGLYRLRPMSIFEIEMIFAKDVSEACQEILSELGLSIPIAHCTELWRSFLCLDEFLGGKEAWVLEWHHPDAPQLNLPPLYLSADATTFADIWGPMWKTCALQDGQTDNDRILSYSVGNGVILPWKLPTSDPQQSISCQTHEVFCHWMSDKDLGEIGDVLGSSGALLRPEDILFIGASTKLQCNTRCNSSTGEIRQHLRNSNSLFETGTIKNTRILDSEAVQIQLGPSYVKGSAQRTYKRRRKAWKEAWTEEWKNNPESRNIRILEYKFGVEVSACTFNARRQRLISLLGSKTMINHLRNGALTWMSPECEQSFYTALESRNHKAFRKLYLSKKNWQSDLGKAITHCLEALTRTGTDAESLNLHWVPNSEPGHRVNLPLREHTWVGFLKDTETCCTMAILENECLELPDSIQARKCQNRGSDSGPIIDTMTKQGFNSSVLETSFMLHQNSIPKPMHPKPCHGHNGSSSRYKYVWSTSSLEAGKKFHFGENGQLMCIKPLGNGQILAKWKHSWEFLEALKEKFQGESRHREYIRAEKGGAGPVYVLIMSSEHATMNRLLAASEKLLNRPRSIQCMRTSSKMGRSGNIGASMNNETALIMDWSTDQKARWQKFSRDSDG
ncbi:uncharacterized protein LY89DRAFT_719074 [Mollisia scopiformis]|uniref:Protein kinase domain-containing protein n=1 Tax=Mollisia scopiformis TaxID=149040 RepID=A0A194X842_MOLSC|nr:uncharacterized protein LY89DRAFT_719074 [Mollisia scopiformis]KUJ16335.1 hypothetical protein LY89DRAFT_719074 [Mollisia scopiformis]